jgi:hypothetical protein
MDTTSSNFEAFFNAALAEYAKQTGKDLRKHPLSSKIDACDSAEDILAIFQEQAKKFDEFRNGDYKLIKWLRPIVNGLHTLSVNAALSAGISLVSQQVPFSSDYLAQCSCHVGVPPGIGDLFRDQCPSIRAYPSMRSPLTILISGITRRPSL